jgi:hypothetical protein
MKTFLRLVSFGIFSFLFNKQVSAQTEVALFTSSSTTYTISKSQPVKVLSFQGNRANNKVSMQWVITDNETAEQFEVERSNDGKNFSTVALVFGTDKAQTETYMFYEKSIFKKVSYRIKCIDKNQTITYSDILIIDLQ